MKRIMLPIAVICMLSSSCGEIIEKQAREDLQQIQNQVAQDAIAQYNLAVKGGDKMEIYMNATLVAESFKQAKDEENYLKWKAISDNHKKEAGLDGL